MISLSTMVAIAAVALAAFFWRRYFLLQQRAAAAALVQRRNAAIVDAADEGVLELDPAGIVIFANPTAARLLGYEVEELLGVDYRGLMSAGELPDSGGDSGRIGYTTDMLRGIGALLTCKNGRTRPVEYRMVPLRHDGTATSLIAFRDLTARSRIDVMLADMQHLAKVGAWELSVGSARLNVSEGISGRLRLSGSRSPPLDAVLKSLTRPSRRKLLVAAGNALRHGDSFDLELQIKGQGPLTTHSGDWVRCIGKPERINGATIRMYGALQDITERKQAEVTLRTMRDFFGATLDAMPSMVTHINRDGVVTYCNQHSLRAALGLDGDCIGQSLHSLLNNPEYVELLQGVDQALAGTPSNVVRAITVNENYRQVHCSFVAEQTGCLLVISDVTDVKMLEARLYQAEKMQAVGQLTGGVAHDFNNMLGVILGNLQLIERDVAHDPAVTRKLATAMRAAMRGTDLTKRLLSFARRQVLDPVIVALDHQLPLFAELIQRTLGDTVQMRLNVAADLWSSKIDLGQLENAILNLVLNACDAMPNGGTVTIAARNFRPDSTFLREHADLLPGDYVEISVSDTGTGIPPQVLSRVFEPFFTTKAVGKGNGLGLSMVHGFAKQSGGTVQVSSEVGQGTRISVVLPRCTEIQPSHEDTIIRKAMPGGSEAILVVEDDTDLRATTVLALQGLGYRVFEASNGEAALRVLMQTPEVDLLFTDVIMPGGVLGPELAQRARSHQPRLRVLLTTGYVGDPVLAQAGQLAGEEMLVKPYRNEDLALKLRSLLD